MTSKRHDVMMDVIISMTSKSLRDDVFSETLEKADTYQGLSCYKYRMEESTVQNAMITKYGLQEKLLVEGQFVALAANKKAANNLLGIGIGMTCLVVAKVDITEIHIDYELLSLTPLSILTFAWHEATMRIKISGKYCRPQIYQLCPSTKQKEIWQSFVHHMNRLATRYGSNVWDICPCTDNSKSAGLEEILAYAVALSDWYRLQSHVFEEFRAYKSLRAKWFYSLHKTSSLPSFLPTDTIENNTFTVPTRSRSATCISAYNRYEDFLLDHANSVRNLGDAPSLRSWNGSAQNLASLDRFSMDISNNGAEDVVKEDIGDIVAVDDGEGFEPAKKKSENQEENDKDDLDKSMEDGTTGTSEKKPSLLKRLVRLFTSCCMKKAN